MPDDFHFMDPALSEARRTELSEYPDG